MTRISIGMPCYGRPAELRNALQHLEQQSFRDFRIILHENPSDSDMIAQICTEFSDRGLVIDYVRHPAQIGVIPNFISVLNSSSSEYFMWAADDDLRHPEALEVFYSQLEQDRDLSLAASSVELINRSGQTIDWQLGFSRFTTGASKKDATLRFLAEPEQLGKANMIYGLFRRDHLLHALEVVGGTFPDVWGQDLVVLAAFLARYEMVATDRVLFKKRTSSDRTRPMAKRYPADFGFNWSQYKGYSEWIRVATQETGIAEEAEHVLRGRLRHLMGLGAVRRAVMRALGCETGIARPPDEDVAWQTRLINRA